mgnify:CR=1 FL=1
MSRKQANEELVKILTEILEQNPELRFSQVLLSFGFVQHTRPVARRTADEYIVNWKDEFYTEPEVILERVKKRIYG